LKKQNSIRLSADKLSANVFAAFAWIACSLIVLIFLGLALKSAPLLKSVSIFKIASLSEWAPSKGLFGLLPFIISTFLVTLLATGFAVPVCLLASTYLVEYAGVRIRSFTLPVVDILAGIPSVIFGIWGVLVLVPFVNFLGRLLHIETEGYSILAAGLVLSVMIVPVLISIFTEVLRTVPKDLRDASLSLGATKWETIFKVIYRKALPGLVAAIILGFSRALGETIAVLMVVGNNPAIPKTVFSMGYPIPALIANNYGEMMSVPMYDAALMTAALILFLIILAFNSVGRIALIKLEKQ
jgi:phosphate transport system permease protein